MALAAVRPAMNIEEKKSIHPFFSKPPAIKAPEQRPSADGIPTDSPHEDADYKQTDSGPDKGPKKRGRKAAVSKIRNGTGTGGENQSSLDRFTRQPNDQDKHESISVNEDDVSAEPSLHEDPNIDRRKRRKTASPSPSHVASSTVDNAQASQNLDWHQQLQIEAQKPVIAVQPEPPITTTVNGTVNTSQVSMPPSIAADKPEPSDAPDPRTQETTPKKKQLKVNKNGKLLSSPPEKAEGASTTPKRRRGRKTSKAKEPATVTVLKYGSDAASRRAIGEKIEMILQSKKKTKLPVTSKKAVSKSAHPSKPTHPFFLGKPAPVSDDTTGKPPTSEAPPPPSPRSLRKSAVTPGKLRAQSRSHQSSTQMPPFSVPGNNRTSRSGGFGEAPWPTKENAHVRNADAATLPPVSGNQYGLKVRKMKSNMPMIPQEEDIIFRLAKQLPSCDVRENLSLSDFKPPQDVRLPIRMLTTGVNIQEQVRRQVQTPLSMASEHTSERITTQPATQALFANIENTLTAFDCGRCESQSWIQKYAPKSASEVLQAGKESTVLYDWLKSLTVLAVGGKHEGSKSGSSSDLKKPPKKKRKKAQDDFIVDSDEEEDEEMIELSVGQNEYVDRLGSSRMKSLRRTHWTRNKNVVLISGPNGCGKSAMAYAVARDLGFEVFEINPGSRRSGKDILDKVGDMTENHLVNHKRVETSKKQDAVLADDNTDNERHSKALQKDLESGRQGTMMSFFKTNSPITAKPKAKVRTQEPQKATTSAQATLPVFQAQRKSQKQSLILFEEADIIFEEDQQFWGQVTKLASLSKRPIIITCNSEALIPSHELPLAAILRLSPPPLDLATDHMLVMAGLEGHVLERDAVSSLYESKNHDLRASITELNFWCQMSVGDRKGGLEWIYQRWPPGKDVDEHGRPLRVASKDTYQPGMGCLSHNVFTSSQNIGFDKEEELLKEVWADWGISPSDWTDHALRKTRSEVQQDPIRRELQDLEHLDRLSDSLSAVDVYCRIDLPTYNHYYEQPTDPSLPLLPDKERRNYTLSAPVLQVDHISDFSGFDMDIFTQSHLLTQRAYGGREASDENEVLSIPTVEHDYIKAIVQKTQSRHDSQFLSRPHFSDAFDVLAYPPDSIPALNTSYNLTASSFDRTFAIVVQDLAPYVRSVVSHELVLETQRVRLGNLLSEGGRTKRARTTRAARTALEGGNRETKRRERWFDSDLNRTLVMNTAGRTWAGMGSGAEEAERSEATGDSLPSTQEA